MRSGRVSCVDKAQSAGLAGVESREHDAGHASATMHSASCKSVTFLGDSQEAREVTLDTVSTSRCAGDADA